MVSARNSTVSGNTGRGFHVLIHSRSPSGLKNGNATSALQGRENSPCLLIWCTCVETKLAEAIKFPPLRIVEADSLNRVPHFSRTLGEVRIFCRKNSVSYSYQQQSRKPPPRKSPDSRSRTSREASAAESPSQI